MSEIHFSASLDSSKLEASIKSSNQTVKDWAKGIEDSGNQADQGLGKMTKSFKSAIAEQKELIKSIEGDVKKLQKAYDDATAGRAKQAAGGELRSAKRALAEEQGTLIGLQKQQIEVNNQEEGSEQKLIGSLKKWALGLVTVGAALKIAKAIINSTEGGIRKFEEVTSGAAAGVNYFFKSIGSGDWTNFFGNLDRAIRGAVEFTDQMEKLANRQNEQKIRSSILDKEIAELRDATYDKDESNNLARQDALAKIIAKQKQKYTEEAKLAKDLYDTNLKKAATDSGLAEDQIKNFISEYSSLEKLIEKGEKYNEITKLTRKAGVNAGFVASLLKERDALGANAKEAGDYVRQISKVIPEVRKQLSDFEADAEHAEAAFGTKNRRDKMQLAEVTNKIKNEAEEKKKKAAEDAELNNRLAKQKELLNDAIEAGAEKDIKAIGARIAALEKEIEARDRLAKKVIDAAEFEGFVPTTVPTSGLLAPKVTPKVKKPTPQKQWESTRKEMENLAIGSEKWQKEMQKAIDENDKERIKQLKEELKLREQIADAVMNLVMNLGEEFGLTNEEMNQLGAAMDAFAKAASGDYAGAAASMLSELITLIPTEAKKFADQIESINQLLEEQQRLVDKSERTGGQADAREKAIGTLKLLKKAQSDDLEKESKKPFKWWSVLLGGPGVLLGAKNQKEKVEALKKVIVETGYSIEEAEQMLDDFLRGGITGNTIADVITQGFMEGKTSVDDFANYMNDVLTNAVVQIFTDSLLSSPRMTAYLEWLKEAMKDGITKEEAELNAKWSADLAAENKANWDSMTSGLDLGNGPNAGLSGQISRSITEATGQELSGILRNQRDDIRQLRDINKMGINHLILIERNTGQTVIELQSAIVELKSIAANTKPAFAGEI